MIERARDPLSPAAELSPASPPSAFSRRLAALRAGALLSLFAHGALIATIAPGRYALAERQSHIGRDRWPTFFSGVAHDTADTAMVFGILVAIPLLFPRALHARRRWATGLFGLVPVACVVLGVTSSCFAEFAIQRGTFPTWFDLLGGVKDTSFITSALEVFLYGRHARPIAVGIACATAFLVAWTRALDDVRSGVANVIVAGCVTASALVAVAAGLPNFPGYGWFPKLGDGDVAGKPFQVFLTPPAGGDTNIRYGVLGIIERAEFSPGSDAPGAAMLGFPSPVGVDGNACSVHPFRRPLPTGDSRAPALVRVFDDLSKVLFDTDNPPQCIVQFLLESFRADDLHALHGAAPEALAPATNKLIDDALSRTSNDLTIPNLFQAGCRSSQGLTANMCGLGMVGFNISASRDLGALPVRCLPDLLIDAGFDSHFVYGAEVSFDGVDDFFRLHGLRNIHGETSFPKHLERGGWGISDLAMLDQLLALVDRPQTAPMSWWIMSTLTNHSPYRAPTDLPGHVSERVRLVTEGRAINVEELGRLRTFSYTDEFLGRAFARIDATPEASRTILIANADHATNDLPLWDAADERALRTRGQIPFILHVPEALVRAHRHPNELRDALTAAQRALAANPVSQNDLPTLILALLGHSAPLKGLPSALRWHTMGGQRTAPDWSLPSRPGAVVGGLNSIGEFFAVDAKGDAVGPLSLVETIASPDDILTDHSEVRPTAALFGHFLRKWGRSCPAPESIRPGSPP